MGGLFSSLSVSPSAVVLVPPLFERQHVDVERFGRSPFSPDSDFFHQIRLGRLFRDYLQEGFHSKLVLSSKQNPSSTVIAGFASEGSRDGGPFEAIRSVGGGSDGGDQSLGGFAAFRFQPQPLAQPYNFLQVAIHNADAEGDREGGGSIQGCWRVHPGTNAFLSGSLGDLASVDSLEVNACYAHRYFQCGVSSQPLHGCQPATGFVAVGGAGVKAAAQCTRDLGRPETDPHYSIGVTFQPGWGPPASDDGSNGNGNRLSTSFQLHDFETLDISVYQRMVVKRRVKNPFERDHVVGISNVIDAGVSVSTDIRPGHEQRRHKQRQEMKLALAWQVNKNVLVKGSASLDSVAAGIAFKSWWDPSLTASLSSRYNYRTKKAGMGLNLRLENVGAVHYARADRGAGFTMPTQESVASQPEIDTQSLDSRPAFSQDREHAKEAATLPPQRQPRPNTLNDLL